MNGSIMMVLITIVSAAVTHDAAAPSTPDPARDQQERRRTLADVEKAKNALKTYIEAKRKEQLAGLQDVHTSLSHWAYLYSLESAGPNGLGGYWGVFGGPAADVWVIIRWCNYCRDRYRASTDFQQTLQDYVDSQAFTEYKYTIVWAVTVGDLLRDHYYNLIDGGIAIRLGEEGEEVVYRLSRKGCLSNSTFIKWVKQAGSAIVDFTQIAMRASISAIERMAGREFAVKASAKAGASEAVERAAEAGSAWLPVPYNPLNATIGFAFMRYTTGYVNNEFLEKYEDAVNSLWDNLKAFIDHAEQDKVRELLKLMKDDANIEQEHPGK